MLIREASSHDQAGVLRIQERAFGRLDEAQLVGQLLDDPTARPVCSLLALEDGRAAGHILFTALHPAKSDAPVSWALLAPLAVLPECQGRGIGAALIGEGCRLLAERGTDLVFVLGDPGYYGRHGFEPAYPDGIEPPFPAEPPEAWMVRDLQGALPVSPRGRVRCADALAAEVYWRE